MYQIVPYVARDLIHPGPERRSRLVTAPVLEHAVKRVLDHVFTTGRIRGQSIEEIEQRHVVTLEELTQRLDFVIADAEHQLLVGHCVAHRNVVTFSVHR
jgi:hypothetical protein